MIKSTRKQQNAVGSHEEDEQNDIRANEQQRKLVKKKGLQQNRSESDPPSVATTDQDKIDNSHQNIKELKKLLVKSNITTKPLQTVPNSDKTAARRAQNRSQDKKTSRKPTTRHQETSVIKKFDPEMRPPLLTPPVVKRMPGAKKELVIVSIFKNEAVAIREWIVHHMWQGVEHFYMIDNGSTDNWQDQIEGLPVTIVNDDERHHQTKHYNQYFLDIVKLRANWALVLDLDEFVYAKDGKTIPSILSRYPSTISRVKLRWKMFGSSGHVSQPPSIIHGFNFRKIMGSKNIRNIHSDSNVKTIVRTEVLNKFDIHCSKISGGQSLFEPSHVSEASLARSNIQCNHYAIQSWEWFKSVKMTRGSANVPANDKVRTEGYFKTYDWNETTDRELSKLVSNIQDSISLHTKVGLC